MSESSTEPIVSDQELALFNWLISMPPHTVIGKRDHETAEDTWWFRLQGNKYYCMYPAEDLHISEIVSKYGKDIFWLESIPLSFVGNILGDLMTPRRWEEEES